MSEMYYVELGQFAFDEDDEWEGTTDTWPPLVAYHQDQAYYPEHRFWKFDAESAEYELRQYFGGVDYIWGVEDATTSFPGQYGIVAQCDVPDDYARILVDGEEVADSGEDFITYDEDDIVACMIKHGDITYCVGD